MRGGGGTPLARAPLWVKSRNPAIPRRAAGFSPGFGEFGGWRKEGEGLSRATLTI